MTEPDCQALRQASIDAGREVENAERELDELPGARNLDEEGQANEPLGLARAQRRLRDAKDNYTVARKAERAAGCV